MKPSYWAVTNSSFYSRQFDVVTIRDTGDKDHKKTPYFVDVYYGLETYNNKNNCLRYFGTYTRNITY